MQSLLVLGRQPALGLAEVESLYGADKLRAVGKPSTQAVNGRAPGTVSSIQAVIVDVDPCLLAFERLGGSVKFCKILTTLETTHWRAIEKFLVQVSPDQSQTMPEGKMLLGLSTLGFDDISLKQLEATGLTIKKAVRKTGRSVRLVPNKSAELNAAQIIHNRLTGPNGWELYLIKDGQKTIVAQTVKVQDIEAYSRRDRERPKRDTRVGMLPPKLAQIIINLATGQLPEDKLSSICDIPAGETIPRPDMGKTILDPFCGTGVILQEALLMGYDVYGIDLESRMVEYSEANLAWLVGLYPSLSDSSPRLETGDATTHTWKPPIDFIASESYLGRPFTTLPTPEILTQTITDCNLILKKFLRNLDSQLQASTRLCLAVPAWQTRPGQFHHLPLIDQIEELGYNRVRFEHARDGDLLYYREDQIVARELLVITRK
jgi:tRNA (guanine10-N2)-dimethyltransferase